MPDLVPARMLNEFAYCPRLFYLEWVHGEWADSEDTEEGRFRHRRVDAEGGSLPPSDEPDGVIHARSVTLASDRLGLIAKLDLVEGLGVAVTPVDYKRGAVPSTPEHSWDADRVQLCAQALVLRENGYQCEEGVLYYSSSRERVSVTINDSLVLQTLDQLQKARLTAEAATPPPPLVDSPKCPRCSQVGICLPDEVQHLAEGSIDADGPRRLVPARDDALPVYVQKQGMTVAKAGDRLEIRQKGQVVQDVRLLDVSQLCLYGNVQVTTQAIRELVDRGIPVCYFTYGGWFYGMTTGPVHKNVDLRRAQYGAAADPARSLALARRFISAKIRNARTMLRRNGDEVPRESLDLLASFAQQAEETDVPGTLLGIEGAAARTYFGHFNGLLKPKGGTTASEFDFARRNRRPPQDPVNALLSYAYSLLTKDFAVTCQAVGFDPHLGFFHTPRYGRPALALDLMEEFRPLLADSTVIRVINNGEITSRDFIRRGGACSLSEGGRRKFLHAYDRRMDQLITHPVFGYSISYRRVLEVQVRLLGRFLLGEIPDYPVFLTR